MKKLNNKEIDAVTNTISNIIRDAKIAFKLEFNNTNPLAIKLQELTDANNKAYGELLEFREKQLKELNNACRDFISSKINPKGECSDDIRDRVILMNSVGSKSAQEIINELLKEYLKP